MNEQTSIEARKLEDNKLGQFFINQIKDLYWSEKLLVKTLPKMVKAANSAKLKDALSKHLSETEQQVNRLERIFDLLDVDKEGIKCKSMAAITDEGEDMINDAEEGTATRDAALIIAGQNVEHHEISNYGGLVSLARCLELNEVVDLLQLSLKEEKEADATLTRIAESEINRQACQELETES